MRLIAAPDGAVNETDRALWLTQPFSLSWFVWITPECRILDVGAEDRTLAVAVEDRAFLAALEDRMLAVSEDRVLAVSEDRVYEVRCG